jgi:hypothetical protein
MIFSFLIVAVRVCTDWQAASFCLQLSVGVEVPDRMGLTLRFTCRKRSMLPSMLRHRPRRIPGNGTHVRRQCECRTIPSRRIVTLSSPTKHKAEIRGLRTIKARRLRLVGLQFYIKLATPLRPGLVCNLIESLRIIEPIARACHADPVILSHL